MNRPILKAVGFWRSYDEHSEFPDPRCLVYPNWHSQIDAIVLYLKNGPTCGYWCGFSYCRFKCRVRSDQMGSTDFTDGEWIWPAGLAHYIEYHSVALPEEFIQAMADNDWACPGVNDLPDALVMR